MKNYTAGLLALLLSLSGSLSSIADAAEKKVLSQQTYKVLMAAQELSDKGDSSQAIAALKQLLSQLDKKPYERAIVLQGISHAQIAQEDYNAAIPPLKQSIELGMLPEEPQQRARYNLIRLLMATEGFAEAIDQLKIWFSLEKQPQAEAYVMLATAHLQLGEFQAAIKPLKTAIDTSSVPKESWYQSLLGAYSELQQYDHCTTLLHTMLHLFPEQPSYWRQLAGIQLTEEKYSAALATMELAHLRGHIDTEKELLNLAQLYLHLNAPYKAATLIEAEMRQGHIKRTEKNLEHAANAWLLARETSKAVIALEKASDTLQNPALGLQLAQLYIESSEWKKAGKTLNGIISSGKLKSADAGQAWMLLGIVQHNARSISKARAAFNQAKRYRKTANSAEQWLAFLNQT